MSDFKFACPKCGQNIVCDTSNAGMQIPCPACNTVLTVPPPPPAVPAAGPAKLGINKTAHHAPAQAAKPAAGNPPPATAWGAKPAPRPAAKKKFPVKLVTTIGVILLLLAVGWFGFGAPYLKEQAEKEKQKQEEAARQAAEQQKAAAEAAAKLKASKAAWKLDLANTDFPDRHASGKIHATDFKVETVIFQSGNLILRQETGLSSQFVISIPVKSGESIAGKSFQVATTDPAGQPRITINWKNDPGKPPGAQTFNKGYAMKLEFGSPADGKVPGKIYLSLPDTEQSYVAGNFEIAPKKIAATDGAPPPDGKRPKKRME